MTIMNDLTDYELETAVLRAQAAQYLAVANLLNAQADVRDREVLKARLVREMGKAAGK